MVPSSAIPFYLWKLHKLGCLLFDAVRTRPSLRTSLGVAPNGPRTLISVCIKSFTPIPHKMLMFLCRVGPIVRIHSRSIPIVLLTLLKLIGTVINWFLLGTVIVQLCKQLITLNMRVLTELPRHLRQESKHQARHGVAARDR